MNEVNEINEINTPQDEQQPFIEEETLVVEENSFALANQHYYQENFEKAIEEFDRTLSVEDQDPETVGRALYWKAEALAKLERFDESIQILEELAEQRKGQNLGYSAKRRAKHLKELKEEMFG